MRHFYLRPGPLMRVARALGRRGAEGVARHHSIARMADRALEIFGSVVAPLPTTAVGAGA